MFTQARSAGEIVAETVHRGFDWGSAVLGAGSGAALVLLLVALDAAMRARAGTQPSRRRR